ncbi:MAG: capsule assembly Wzi family protein [Daejeonella sp.]
MGSFEDYYRREQLLGKVDSSLSFTIRPLLLPNLLKDTSAQRAITQVFQSKDAIRTIAILPVTWQQQYSSSPFNSRNDGPVIPARGYQSMLSAGVFGQLGPFTVQIRPDFVFAGNDDFLTRANLLGSADLPPRFGDRPYTQLSWGQSSIRLNFDPISVGISNENLWWGPGISNSLLMSNTAPGFKHITLNTSRPVKTPVGSFESQVVAGRLEGSGFNQTLPDDWRYLSGFAFGYQPKWIRGLFLGLTRSFQIYHDDMDGSFGDIFPLLQAFQKANTNEDAKRRDQLTSIFTRWLLPSAKAEVYFEYGLNDHSSNIRDFLMSPEHSRSYIFGMKKVIPYKQRSDEFIQFSAEITRMEQSIDRTIREAGEWYTHSQVLHGYTNRGQVLGAGIGPGGNLQSLNISWVKGLKQIGLELERYEHNGDLATAYGYAPWLDFSLGAVADWTFDKLLINGKLSGIQSMNYQWNDGINRRPKQNVFNVNAQLGIMYSF